MKFWMVALMGTGLIAAQNPSSASSYLGKTWVGLLVSGTCAPGKNAAAAEEADRTVGARVTTPAVDTAGTRGSSEAGDTPVSTKGDVPQTGDISLRDNGKIKDPGWRQARRQASGLGAGCRVSVETRQFGLLMPDGSLLRFDDLANSKIADQLRSRGTSGRPEILRVQVVGKVENGMLALDELRM